MALTKKTGINNWLEDDRPREKLQLQGPGALSNSELLAILLGSGTREKSAVDVAQEILQSLNNDFDQLARLSVHQMKQQFKGVGLAKATTIAAALEMGRRRKVTPKKQIRSSQDVADLMQPILADLPHEEFWVLYLSQSNRVMEQSRLTQGGVSGTVTDVRLILKKAINLLASALVLVHNHPSGNLTPSQSDKTITNKVQQAARVMDIRLLDHLIVSDEGTFSFADEGLLAQSE